MTFVEMERAVAEAADLAAQSALRVRVGLELSEAATSIAISLAVLADLKLKEALGASG